MVPDLRARAEVKQRVGEMVAVHIIPRPHVNVDLVLPLGRANAQG